VGETVHVLDRVLEQRHLASFASPVCDFTAPVISSAAGSIATRQAKSAAYRGGEPGMDLRAVDPDVWRVGGEPDEPATQDVGCSSHDTRVTPTRPERNPAAWDNPLARPRRPSERPSNEKAR
jgi:hypothetical protein